MTYFTSLLEAEQAAHTKSKELTETWETISFDGQNCDNCVGWNGTDCHCGCGNRRVYWEFDQLVDGTWIYYAAAW